MATPFIENFNSLSNGNLNTQNGWSGSTAFQVEGTVVSEGAKAVSLTPVSDGDYYIYKQGTMQSAGRAGAYVRTGLVCPAGADPELHFNEGTNYVTGYRGRFQFWPDGIYGTYKSGTVKKVKLSSYVANTWYWLEMEWQSSPSHQIRYKIDNNNWSIWYSPEVDWTTGIDTIYLYGEYHTYTKYFDHIGEQPLNGNFFPFF